MVRHQGNPAIKVRFGILQHWHKSIALTGPLTDSWNFCLFSLILKNGQWIGRYYYFLFAVPDKRTKTISKKIVLLLLNNPVSKSRPLNAL